MGTPTYPPLGTLIRHLLMFASWTSALLRSFREPPRRSPRGSLLCKVPDSRPVGAESSIGGMSVSEPSLNKERSKNHLSSTVPVKKNSK